MREGDLNDARRGLGGTRRAATNGNGLTAAHDYRPILGASQPQRLTTSLVGREKGRTLAAILADMNRAFNLGKYELAAIYLKEWRAAQQGGEP